MNYWIGPTVKPVWNFVLHMLHNFLGCGIKTRAYHLRKYILHLLLLKISIFISKKFYNTCLSSRRAIVNKVYLLFRLISLFALQNYCSHWVILVLCPRTCVCVCMFGDMMMFRANVAVVRPRCETSNIQLRF